MRRYIPTRLFVCVLLALSSVRPSAEIIDRILAVVGGELILLSDATAAVRFGLVQSPAKADDPIVPTLNALIDRQLQLFEVNRYLPPEPTPEAIDEQLAGIRARFPSPDAYQAVLAESGMTEAQLRSGVRDNLRIQSYRNQRFAAALQPSEDDLVRYYRLRETEFTKDGVLQPFAEVREQLRARVAAERSAALINDWLETLRGRSEVQILHRGR